MVNWINIILFFSIISLYKLNTNDNISIYQNENINDVNIEENESDKIFLIEYQSVFNKNYSNEELFKRLEILNKNLKKIIKFNKLSKSYKIGITQFTDSTLDELASKYLDIEMNKKIGLKLNFLQNIHLNKDFYSKFNLNLNSNYLPIDWRSKDIFLPVRDQGDCGACWAFASVGTVEALRAKEYKTKEYLSPQQLMDCDLKEKGCKGGWPSIAYNYASANGIVTDQDYPYTAMNGQCKSEIVQSSPKAKIDSNFARCEEDECLNNDIQYNMLKNGPITVVIDAYHSNFFNYKTGIYDESCGEPNHAVMLVGYGIEDNTGIKYWIIRNSWGKLWGMDGYGYVKFDKSNYLSCNLNRYGYQPKVLN